MGDKSYQCQYCGKRCSDKSNLRKHHIHTGDKHYQCQYCGKDFYQNIDLQRHLCTHTGDKPYQCEYYGKRFSQNASLQRHHHIHTGNRPYQCQYCGKDLVRMVVSKLIFVYTLVINLTNASTVEKEFIQNSNLKKHLRSHTGDKPYQCQYCGKGYKQSFNLQTHVRIHTGDKPYQCWKKISL